MRTLLPTLLLFSFIWCAPSIAKQQDLDRTQAVQKAKQSVQGRVLKVKQQKNSYQVKMLKKSGQVVSVNVDKKSGKVTKRQSGKKKN